MFNLGIVITQAVITSLNRNNQLSIWSGFFSSSLINNSCLLKLFQNQHCFHLFLTKGPSKSELN